MTSFAASVEVQLAAVGCSGALHVRALNSGYEVGFRENEPMIAASVIKTVIALEFFCRSSEGRIDPHEIVSIDPETSTPGPTGISNFEAPASISLRDLAELMMAISDNAATDILIGRLGLDRVNRRVVASGCTATRIVSNIATMLDSVGADMGFESYRGLLDAQSGRLGEEARKRSIDPERIDACRALDPARTTCTTASDMTQLLSSIWQDRHDPPACASLRKLMERQVTRRIEPAVPPAGTLAAKSGGLFRRVRNEIGVVTLPDGARFAFAVFTRTKDSAASATAINSRMADLVGAAIEHLRT